MKTNQGRALAALSLALLWLFASPARVAAFDCYLVFEAIPSEDAGPIFGQLVKHNLAGKKFTKWGDFTGVQAGVIVGFLRENFGDKLTFADPEAAMGGFQGKSSPNATIAITLKTPLESDELGEVITPVTAAVGFILIQDGTVANCEKSVGKFGSTFPLFSVERGQGFNALDERFVRTVYSAMVAANDNLDIGYTFFLEEMQMLDIGGSLEDQVGATNVYFEELYSNTVSIVLQPLEDEWTIYAANNWAIDRQGTALLAKVPTELRLALIVAREVYLQALKEFAAKLN